MKKVEHSIFSAEVKYEFTVQELMEIIRVHAGLPDGVVEFDVSNQRRLRGASIKVQRTEIKG